MTTHNERARALVRGAVQGVGFRPFVYRLAKELRLTGWVRNSADGVFIEAEGVGATLREFLLRLQREKPARAIIQSLEFSFLDAVGYSGFVIRDSEESGAKSALISPDIAPCEQCLIDIFSPTNRRFRYPFTNCTHCGPRFTIIAELPYDRPRTAMKKFKMCAVCEREYHDPNDRRFHAQPNACPQCGPQLEIWDAEGNVLASGDAALRRTAQELRTGKIVALKGLGGFQLLTDARDEAVVKRLRKRKQRAEKPFALMYPSLVLVRRDCRISQLEERLLLAPEAPIVLLQRWSPPLAPSIAPGNPTLGVMLPSTPLHHLLLREIGFPLVCTSGNLADEPLCIDERDALARLEGVADFFLMHNRPILRPMDDSVVRVVRGREMVLRRARGYAPLPIQLPQTAPPILAVGAELKNTVALSVGRGAFISQHLGDLESSEAYAAFRSVASDLPRLYDTAPEIVACDLHPDYLSTKYATHLAAELDTVVHPVQHHWAHVLACMTENEVPFPALGVAWDGGGYGTDGTLWGGEFLLAREDGFERVAHLRQFRLPGGDDALRQPRRAALGVLFEMGGARALERAVEPALERSDLPPLRDFPESELTAIRQMLARNVQSPITSSVGRLFDAVAALTGLRQQATFDGQSAMELEFAVHSCVGESYRFELKSTAPCVIDWRPMLQEIVDEVRGGVATGIIAAKFHNTVVEFIVAVARLVGQTRVVLSGDSFQNRYLTERAVQRLLETGFRPYWHQRVPTNDGGISLGQIVDASRRKKSTAGPASEATRPAKLTSEMFA